MPLIAKPGTAAAGGREASSKGAKKPGDFEKSNALLKLSAFFTLGELCNPHHNENWPVPKNVAENLRLLSGNILDKIRIHFGVPVIINSGYRSAARNAKTPGAAGNSQHITGEAADLHVLGHPNFEVADWIAGSGILYGQLILESSAKTHGSGWVHVSLQRPNWFKNQTKWVSPRPGDPSIRKYTQIFSTFEDFLLTPVALVDAAPSHTVTLGQ